jgi:alpha-glucosidase
MAPGVLTAALAASLELASPDGRTKATVGVEGGRLVLGLTLGGRPALVASPIGIVVDGSDLGQGAVLGPAKRTAVDERFPWRGVHSEARNRYQGVEIPVRHAASGTLYTLAVRAFDDAVGYRFVVPGQGRRVPDAGSTFRIPEGSLVWVQGPRDHYEGLYTRKPLAEVADGEWATPPLTAQLPGGAGFLSITEAGLVGYAGMMLQGDGAGGFRERLGHAVPASYPYELRYGKDNAARLATAAAVEGTITTPWRVILLGADLNALVNSDAIPALSAPPDPAFFPEGARTAWLRPGRAVWRYLDNRPAVAAASPAPSPSPSPSETPEEREVRIRRGFEEIKDFSRLAGELGFEHQVVEGQWRQWTDDQIRELVAYSTERGVSVWLWIHSRDQRDPATRRELFRRLHRLGVAGLKIDFFDHEAKETIDLYQDVLRDAAESRLMVNFHGANKPAGEARTWPNEMTREGIRGLEYGRTPAWSEHNTIVPFTRLLAGHADYTPVVFGERRKETSWPHQIATAVVLTSPLMVYGAHPASLLANPAVDVVRSLPATWDETRVLPGSAIGEAAVFARRSGDRWFLGVLNGPAARTLKVPLSFLGRGTYRASFVKDQADDPAAVVLETRAVSAAGVLEIVLRPGGGFVGRFVPGPPS